MAAQTQCLTCLFFRPRKQGQRRDRAEEAAGLWQFLGSQVCCYRMGLSEREEVVCVVLFGLVLLVCWLVFVCFRLFLFLFFLLLWLLLFLRGCMVTEGFAARFSDVSGWRTWLLFQGSMTKTCFVYFWVMELLGLTWTEGFLDEVRSKSHAPAQCLSFCITLFDQLSPDKHYGLGMAADGPQVSKSVGSWSFFDVFLSKPRKAL